MTFKPSPRNRQAAKAMEPAIDPAGWTAEDLGANDDWVYELSDVEINEVREAVSAVERRGMDILDIRAEDFPLPQKAVEDEANAIFKGMAQSGMEQGVERDEIESKRDELWKQAQTNGQARVKIGIVLGRIAEKEEVKVSNEDLAQAATREAMSRRVDPQAYVKELTADRARLSRLQRDVLHDKTIDLIAGKCTEKVCEIEGDHKH